MVPIKFTGGTVAPLRHVRLVSLTKGRHIPGAVFLTKGGAKRRDKGWEIVVPTKEFQTANSATVPSVAEERYRLSVGLTGEPTPLVASNSDPFTCKRKPTEVLVLKKKQK